ncbi:MAG: hypothetical protein AB2813_06770 [Candidatus Sedimenticola endophacoides]
MDVSAYQSNHQARLKQALERRFQLAGHGYPAVQGLFSACLRIALEHSRERRHDTR